MPTPPHIHAKESPSSQAPFDKKFDVVVVGNGLTALFCLWNLKKRGYQNIGWSTRWPTPPLVTDLNAAPGTAAKTATSWLTPDLMANYPLDHLTRFIHRLGPRLGPEVWAINHLGFKTIAEYCLDQGIPIKFGTQRCDALSEPELSELKIFDRQARRQAQIPQGQFQMGNSLGNMPTLGSLIHHPKSSAWLETKDLARQLISEIAHYQRIPAVVKLDSDADGINLSCSPPPLRVKAEIAIIACHTNTAEILPDLDPVLVNIVDQWDEFEFSLSRPSLSLKPGDFFKLNYGQTWGMITPDLKLRMGGSRFLRGEKNDAIQLRDNPLKESSLVKKISTFHAQIGQQITSPSISSIRSQTFVDILPCDELPIIGPMYNDSRILLATGFYGFGLPLVSLAGLWLAQIIDEGIAPGLLPCFLPHRLRSLTDNGF